MPLGMQPAAPRRVERLIINLDTAMPLTCAWDECDARARTTWQIRVHEHPPGLSCAAVTEAGGAYGRHAHYAFCCEGHLGYWADCSGWRANELAARRGGRIYGNRLPGATGRKWL